MKGNPRSPHKRGVACDFRIEGVALPVLRDYLRNTFHGVGVGYYPISNFVHLDVGRKQDAFWIDYSGPGETPRYGHWPPTDHGDGLHPVRDLPVYRGSADDVLRYQQHWQDALQRYLHLTSR